jgi:hypothetical protein
MCRNGLNEMAPENTARGRCKACRAEYGKQYYAKNKERFAEHNKQYRAENKERIKQYYAKNKERIAEYGKQYYAKNKERSKQYYAENKERIAEYEKRKIQKATNSYLARSHGLKTGEAPPIFFEIARLNIQLKRELRKCKETKR